MAVSAIVALTGLSRLSSSVCVRYPLLYQTDLQIFRPGRFEALIEFAAAAVACEVLGPVFINRMHRNTFEVQTKTRIFSCVTTYLTTWQTANINRVPIGRNKDLGVGKVHMIITGQ